MKRMISLALSIFMLAGGGVALAAAPPMPVRGTIDAVNGRVLSVTETAGTKAYVTLAPDAIITEVIPGSRADVKVGTYVGTAAVKQPDGIYRAMELQVFPDSMRGIGLGTRKWNLAPHSTMTNGTVGAISQTRGTVGALSGSGNLTLHVNDGSGSKTILIPDGVPVVTYAPGSIADLSPGAHVIFFPTSAAAGSFTTSRINVGKNGMTPPM